MATQPKSEGNNEITNPAELFPMRKKSKARGGPHWSSAPKAPRPSALCEVSAVEAPMTNGAVPGRDFSEEEKARRAAGAKIWDFYFKS